MHQLTPEDKQMLRQILRRYIKHAWVQLLLLALSLGSIRLTWPATSWLQWLFLAASSGLSAFWLWAAWADWDLYQTFKKAKAHSERQRPGRRKRARQSRQ